MNIIFLILFIFSLTFIYGSTVGWAVHAILHTKMFEYLAHNHNIHHTLYTIYDFESYIYRDAGYARSTLVFVPIITIALLFISIPLWFIFQIWWIYLIMMVIGILVGGLNDWIHTAFHIKNHWMNKYKFFQNLKYLHYLHHKYPNKNYGIIWFGVDKIFGTFKS